MGIIPATKPFKGIALFTPGGDVLYGIDPSKQQHWHAHLCLALQDLLGLPEPPHFLVPGYTATLDRWQNPTTKVIHTFAEVYPAVQRYQGLLNAIFNTQGLIWQTASWQEEFCNPTILEGYRQQFPQLWESHDLVMQLDRTIEDNFLLNPFAQAMSSLSTTETPQGYVLRLFVSGSSQTTQKILETIHQLLETGLKHPYTLKVIDITKHPEQAESHHVSATPTLVRVWPEPVKRIIGELEDLPKVLQIIANG